MASDEQLAGWGHPALIEQLAQRHAQRCREPSDDGDRRVARAAFDVADIGPVDTSLVGERFLAPAFAEAQGAQVLTEAVTDVHPGAETLASTIDLQTISGIVVDWGGRPRIGQRHLSSTGGSMTSLSERR